MPMEKARYPADWKKIARDVKDSAGWVCQGCGKQCRRPGEPFDTHTRTLTVHHLNHMPEDCRTENLIALCAPCHLRADAAFHAEHRREKWRKSMAKLDAEEVYTAIHQLLRYSKSLTKNTNPIAYMHGNASFVDMMNDEETHGFGDWMFANGYNTALVTIEVHIQEMLNTVCGIIDMEEDDGK